MTRRITEITVRSSRSQTTAPARAVRTAATTMAGLICVASACREQNTFVPPPPPKVTVALPVRQEVVSQLQFSGRTAAVASVEIRPRVEGYITEIHFEEGAEVKEGDLLYTIDQAPYLARRDAAKADLARAEALLERATYEYERVNRLKASNAATAIELVNAEADLKKAQADVLAFKAALEMAELDLSYTEIRAAVAGQIGESRFDKGNLVGRGEPTLLTTIEQYNPIYLYFTVNERDVLLLRQAQIRAMGGNVDRSEIPVYLQTADGQIYGIPGRIDYVDNTLDPQTGTVNVRAVFENPQNLLLPGMFARALAPRPARDALLVPESALLRDLAGTYLMVVGDSGEVDRVDIRTGIAMGSMRVVSEGLSGDEKVVIKGIQRVRPGITVQAEVIALPTVPQTLPVASPPASAASGTDAVPAPTATQP